MKEVVEVVVSVVDDLVRSRVMWLFALHAIGFGAAVAVLPPELYFPILHALRLSIAIVLVITFSRGLWPILRQREIDQGSQLVLGILCAWSAEVLMSVWSLVWRIGDQTWMLDSPVLAGLLYCKVIGGALHVTSPRAVDGQVPRRSWVLLGVASVVAALMAGIIIGLRWGALIERFI